MDIEPTPPGSVPVPEWTQWQFVDALGDGVYGVDTTGNCIFVNAAAVRMLGYTRRDELIGRNMHAAIHHTRPDGSPFPQAECPLLHTLVSRLPVRLENEMLWRWDGTPFFAEYSSFPVLRDGDVTGSVITFSDVSVRQDAQRRLAVQHAVSQVLAGAAGADLPARLLEAVGAGLGWDVGVFWLIETLRSGHEVLRCTESWRSRDCGRAAGFGQDRIGWTLEFAAGLPGQAWAEQGPVHVADLASDTSSLRQAAAAQLGLHSAFAFPLMDGQAVVGAVEFYSRRRIDLDESLLEAVSTLGHQIGQAMQRSRVAEALVKSEQLKAAILAGAPDGVITIDADGRILEFNAAAEAIFGRPVADMLGHELAATIFPEETRELHRKTFALAVAGDADIIGRRVEVDAEDAAGRRFPIELSITRTASGDRPMFTAHLRDISVRRREQASMRQSEARFRTIANAIPQLSWMTDPTGAVIWYNQRWYDYTGTTLADMQGWGWKSVHDPEHLDRVEQRLRESFASGQDWEDTFPLRSKDGEYNWFLSRALPIREAADEACPQGRILGWFGTNTDVTAMREAEASLSAARDEAEEANRAKSTFIANMSHELRTPLSAIIGYAEMLGEEIEDGMEPADLTRDVRKIEGNARHLLGLINDVLDLSKVESGKMEAYAEAFDVAEMVRDVASTVGALMDKKQNRLTLRLDEPLGTMHSDVTRIRQVLLNLLSNAAKFTEAGDITLSAERVTGGRVAGEGGDQLVFAVADTGIGMTPEQLEKLFQRFHQADASTTRQFGGTGLGLALTKAFATLLGGTVQVTSSPGAGSRFAVSLPVTLAVAAPSDEPAPAPVEAGSRETILVVDDDETQRHLMARFLTREGFAPRLAADGATGLAMARALRPRAILLDVTMPGMDGWSVLSALKADRELAGIPVVMVTFVTERALANSLGASDYLVKPVDWERLRQVMERFRSVDGDVLVVDDDADTRARLRSTLERHGWTVVEAADGREALDVVARALPRVILLDLTMPVMDGFTFLRELRDRPGCAEVAVIVLTALDLSAEDRKRLRGANQVLNKGDVDLADLAEKLRRYDVRSVAGD